MTSRTLTAGGGGGVQFPNRCRDSGGHQHRHANLAGRTCLGNLWVLNNFLFPDLIQTDPIKK